MGFVDLSHRIEDGKGAYRGLPEPRIWDDPSHAASRSRYGGRAEFAISHLQMAGNTGTYIDSPYHRYPDAPDVSGLGLAQVAGLPGIVLDVGPAGPVEIVVQPDRLRGRAVLFRSGWDRRWGTPAYWEPGPFLGRRTLEVLVEAEVALVGVDFANVDDTDDLSRPAHTELLGCETPVVEHLCRLDRLGDRPFRFFAVPLAVVGAATVPVRAFAEVASPPG